MEYFNPIARIKPDQKFYDSIIQSLILIKLPTAHTITLKMKNYTMIGAKIKNVTTKKLAIIVLLGYYAFTKFKGGIFQFEISALGY